MRLLFGELLAKSPLLALPLAAFILFAVVFTAASVRAWRGRNRYESIARLPLEGEDHE